MNIYIPIEVKLRELDGRSLLAFAAAERGHTVILGQKKFTINSARNGFLPPGIVHDKSVTPAEYKVRSYSLLKEKGHVITAQDEESGLADPTYTAFAKRRFGKETLSLVDKYFTWGDFDHHSLQEIFTDYKDKFVKTGSPRVDFWRPDFEKYYKRTDLSDDKPFILVVSNFGSVLDVNRFYDKIARLRQAGYFERDPKKERQMYENDAYQLNMIQKFVELIRTLSTKYPKINILVRPHPIESVKAWHQLIGDFPNVKVHRDDTISKYIRKSLIVIQNGCHSAFEAAACGAHRIAFRPIPSKFEREIPNQLCLNTYEEDEVLHAIEKILNGTDVNNSELLKNTDEILKKRLENVTGELAVDKIVDQWELLADKFSLKSSSVSDIRDCKPKKKTSFKKLLKNKLIDLGFLRRNKTNNGKYLKSHHKFPSLEKSELISIKEKVSSTLHRFESIKIEEFDEKSFLIYC